MPERAALMPQISRRHALGVGGQKKYGEGAARPPSLLSFHKILKTHQIYPHLWGYKGEISPKNGEKGETYAETEKAISGTDWAFDEGDSGNKKV